MKKYNNLQLENILKDLLCKDAVYTAVKKIDGNIYCFGKICGDDGKNLIRYENFGTSAIKANKTELSWLLNTIFNKYDEIAPCKINDGEIIRI